MLRVPITIAPDAVILTYVTFAVRFESFIEDNTHELQVNETLEALLQRLHRSHALPTDEGNASTKRGDRFASPTGSIGVESITIQSNRPTNRLNASADRVDC